MYVASLFLRNFRSHNSYDGKFSDGFVAFVGENGVGKTNILEAISLLTFGRGLRGLSQWSQLCRNGKERWFVEGRIQKNHAPIILKAVADSKGKGRIVSMDDKRIAPGDLSPLFSALWLLPEEESLWRQSASLRRHFLDRMAPHLFPEYASCRKRYKKGLMERQSLLRAPHLDLHWLESIEREMAKSGIILASYRYEFVILLLKKALQKLCVDYDCPMFTLNLEGNLEKIIHSQGASLAEEWFLQKLCEKRDDDRQTGRCSYGPHLCDMSVLHKEKKISSSQCSKGEQDLLSLLLLSALHLCIRKRTEHSPVLLLDEMLSRLDSHYLMKMVSVLTSMNTQILITGTPQNTIMGLPHLHKIVLS